MTIDEVTLKVPINETQTVPHTIKHLVIQGESVIAQPPVIFLGNSLGSPEAYRNTAEHLAFFGDVYVPMLAPVSGHTKENNVTLLEAYLDAQRLQNVSLIGYRRGTIVACDFTRKHADTRRYHVDQLTLLDPGAVDVATFPKTKLEVITSPQLWPGTFVIGVDGTNPDHNVQLLTQSIENPLYDTVTLDEISENSRRASALSEHFAVPKYGFRKIRELMARTVDPVALNSLREASVQVTNDAITAYNYHSRPK